MLIRRGIDTDNAELSHIQSSKYSPILNESNSKHRIESQTLTLLVRRLTLKILKVHIGT